MNFDAELRNFFASSRKMRLGRRKGPCLVLEDDTDFVFIVEQILKGIPMAYEITSTIAMAKAQIQERGFDSFSCVIVDYYLPDGQGLEFIDWLQKQDRSIPTMLWSADEVVVKKVAHERPSLTPVYKGNAQAFSEEVVCFLSENARVR